MVEADEFVQSDSEQHDDLLYEAWGVIANAGGGDWTTQTDEWVEAAVRWRDRFHAHIGSSGAP